MKRIAFTVNALAQPQGSMNGYTRGNHVVITSANKKLQPFREQVTCAAHFELMRTFDDYPESVLFGKHIPVRIELVFTFVKPKSAKKRVHSVVKPDLDKLVRGVFERFGPMTHNVSRLPHGRRTEALRALRLRWRK